MSDEILARIDELMDEIFREGSPANLEFEETRRRIDTEIAPLIERLRNSERLTADDLSTRVHLGI